MACETISNLLFGLVRGQSRPNASEGADTRIGVLNGGEVSVAQGLPPKTEIVRLGNSWNCAIPTGNAFTNVADMPTTRSELALYNGDSTKTYVIDSIWYLSLTSITALSNATLIYQVGFPAALTDNTAILINSPRGLTYNGRAKRALATTTMVANKWCAVAAATQAATASIGFGVVANIDGGILVTPGGTLGVNAVLGTATGTALMGISWHEVTLNV